MSKGKVYISNYPDNPPEWYWISGLHDACIIGTESFEFPFDYNEFIGEKNIYNRNLITLRINASCYIIKSQTASAIWDFQLSAFAFN